MVRVPLVVREEVPGGTQKVGNIFFDKKICFFAYGFYYGGTQNVFCSFSGTWKFVSLIWWYAAEKRLGTPDLHYQKYFLVFTSSVIFSFVYSDIPQCGLPERS